MFNTRHLRKFRYEKSVLSASKNYIFLSSLRHFKIWKEIPINTRNFHLNKYLFNYLDFIIE